MMEFRQTLVQGLTQQMIMTPKMQQAIEMLQLCTIELEHYLEEQLTENPLLEEVPSQDQETDAPTSADYAPTADMPRDTEPKNDESERNIDEEIESLMASYSNYRYEGRDFSVPGEDGKRGFIENTAAEPESMIRNLLGQLSLSTDNPSDYKIGEWIISEIDERGYFSSSVEAGSQTLSVEPEEIERVLRLVQTFTPIGIGARDLRDCLLIQIEASHSGKPLLKKIVQDHLELLAKKQYPKIARMLNISVEHVQELGTIIASLEPMPGRYFSNHKAIHVTPDVIVKKVDDEYVVYMNDDGLPKLRISSFYRNLLRSSNGNPKTKEYIRDKLRSAQWLVKNIQQRKDTIQNVAQNIVDVQKDFLDKGIAYLKPLILKEIAERIGMHESTVSRVTTNKYMETPRGIFELKYFFSSGIASSYGEAASSKSVKEVIRTLIENEDKRKPLSDQETTALLSKRGFKIARRTAAKYREELGILSSKYRREY
ncbi:MAG: RNA polymerase sigma-54 factor [Candidatus Abyssobacteria bacterium SURF_17]|uniref:RNA polymerase sigma-54 factor n=1 Tax=Candidatus Abyssobacteria bacterium SURF_17 TaxID=2093361 RepID=A0A419ENG1_9BACT|nr:MAG: RNA polymerase sigma-54 factor [Candidatus Abyssubacteria bacterium SURF_17]